MHMLTLFSEYPSEMAIGWLLGALLGYGYEGILSFLESLTLRLDSDAVLLQLLLL
jgi:hypothetical protein